jgi:hypothetical protein
MAPVAMSEQGGHALLAQRVVAAEMQHWTDDAVVLVISIEIELEFGSELEVVFIEPLGWSFGEEHLIQPCIKTIDAGQIIQDPLVDL